MKWSFATGGYVWSSPAIGADGTVYVGSYNFKVYAIDTSCGGLANTPWPKFRYDAANTGRVPSIKDLLHFFDVSVKKGELKGAGPLDVAQINLDACRDIIEKAGTSKEMGKNALACKQLLEAYKAADGLPQPPDLVAGPAVNKLRSMVLELKARWGCPAK